MRITKLKKNTPRKTARRRKPVAAKKTSSSRRPAPAKRNPAKKRANPKPKTASKTAAIPSGAKRIKVERRGADVKVSFLR